MCDKMAISAYIMKTAENDPFLRPRTSLKGMFMTTANQFIDPNVQ